MAYYRHKKTKEIIKWTAAHFEQHENGKEYEFVANTQRELVATPPKKSVRKKRGKK